MLTIRPEQLDVLKRASVQKFEDRMVDHLNAFTPRHFKILNEDEIRDVIQHGRELAKQHGYRSERSVRLYIEMMFMLGSGFFTDPQYSWISQIVDRQADVNASASIDLINKKTWELVEQASLDYIDPNGNFDPSRFIEQLRKLHDGLDQFASALVKSESTPDISQLLQNAFPHKFNYIGATAVQHLTAEANQKTALYQIFTQRGVAIFAAMMFILGSGFDHDPILPWVPAILKDPSLSAENEKIDRLHTEALNQLQMFLA